MKGFNLEIVIMFLLDCLEPSGKPHNIYNSTLSIRFFIWVKLLKVFKQLRSVYAKSL